MQSPMRFAPSLEVSFHPAVLKSSKAKCGRRVSLCSHSHSYEADVVKPLKCFFSLQELGTFTDGMTHGRGFIALAAIIVGRWMPFRVMLGCLLFGAASALALNIQGWGLPVSSYVIQMTPYLIALAVLCGIGRRARMPAAIGKSFTRS
jgi:hypothetical protein